MSREKAKQILDELFAHISAVHAGDRSCSHISEFYAPSNREYPPLEDGVQTLNTRIKSYRESVDNLSTFEITMILRSTSSIRAHLNEWPIFLKDSAISLRNRGLSEDKIKSLLRGLFSTPNELQ